MAKATGQSTEPEQASEPEATTEPEQASAKPWLISGNHLGEVEE